MESTHQTLKLQNSLVMKILIIIIGSVFILYGLLLSVINKGYYPGCIICPIIGVYIIVYACRFIEVKTDRIVYRNFFKKKIVLFSDIKMIEESYVRSHDIDTGADFSNTVYTVIDKNNKKLFSIDFGDVDSFLDIAKRYKVKIRRATS